MKLAEVYIEHSSLQLDQSFSYLCGHAEVRPGMRVSVPFAKQQLVGFVDSVKEVSADELKQMPYELKEIQRVIDERPLLNDELLQLGKWMAEQYVAPLISCYQAMLPGVLKPKSSARSAAMEEWACFAGEREGLSKRQREVLDEMKQRGSMRAVDYRREYKSVARKLIELGCVRIEKRKKVPQLILSAAKGETLTLCAQQSEALAALNAVPHHEVVLLHGVTGSGKSEVFLRYARQMVEQGRQVLLLVPEISLTPQMIARVRERFPDDAAVYHSRLSNQQKYEQYELVREGRVHVVVGTRSAVFMPFVHLGAIILDEEHDTSYKQDSSPRYHCRDIAIQRGKTHDCKVILASATPSLESYARAYKGVYRLIEMKARINQRPLPEVEVVDMKECLRCGGNAMLSPSLMEALDGCLRRGEQAMLLLNRRGYTPVLRCLSCGEVLKCPHCEVALSYHKQENCLKCHVCGYSRMLPGHCPTCGANDWRSLGMGTQRLEEYVQHCFPQARIVRMDADTTRVKGAHETLLEQFSKDADILLGTQMIAKGLDYARVTLVGILNADAMLNRGDYRCSEMTYDLLEQACGRSGRGERSGRVILQAYDCAHYAVRCAAAHDYEGFFRREMQFRHLAQYPPYAYLSAVVLHHRNAQTVREDALAAREALSGGAFKVLGPIELGRLRDECRWRLILKGKDRHEQAAALRRLAQAHRMQKRRSRLEIDVDLMMLE